MLVGHSDAVLTVAVSVTNKSQVISGSKDCNLIVWDLHTGEEIHTLAGHLGPVTCVKVSADGNEASFFTSLFLRVEKKMENKFLETFKFFVLKITVAVSKTC